MELGVFFILQMNETYAGTNDSLFWLPGFLMPYHSTAGKQRPPVQVVQYFWQYFFHHLCYHFTYLPRFAYQCNIVLYQWILSPESVPQKRKL